MKSNRKLVLALLLGAALPAQVLIPAASAADKDHEIIEQVMKDYHKAPKGVDPVCKKAADGKASADEIKKLVEGYRKMAKTSPPKGDAASWKEKTAKLLAAAEGLQKGAPDAAAKYKEAVNCKACHSEHKPD